MDYSRIIFSAHAIQRMFERCLTKNDVLNVLDKGKVIKSYPEDKPHPSHLVLGFADEKPLHIVVGVDQSASTAIIVTVYEPDPELWNNNFQTRRES